MNVLKQSILMFLVLTIICGILYPLAITAVAQVIFPFQANGSMIGLSGNKGQTSELIGQEFIGNQYFWSRLSATSPMPYNAGASGGSNLGPSNPQLKRNMQDRIEKLHSSEQPPIDLVTSSGSGLDPHITPEAALYQVSRVAAARNISTDQLETLIHRNTEPRQFGLLGKPRVNVLLLNAMLDKLHS
jgi:K+-transporting ATPase KdpC subunit